MKEDEVKLSMIICHEIEDAIVEIFDKHSNNPRVFLNALDTYYMAKKQSMIGPQELKDYLLSCIGFIDEKFLDGDKDKETVH